MNYSILLESFRNYKKFKRELTEAQDGYGDFQREKKQLNESRFNTLGANINSFCGSESFRSVIKKLCTSFEGRVSLINGELAYCGRALPARSFNYQNAHAVADKCVADMKSCVQGLTRGFGNADMLLRALCECYSTLKSIYVRINFMKKEALDAELERENNRISTLEASISRLVAACPELKDPDGAEALLDELYKNMKLELERFRFEGITVNQNYGEAIRLPIAVQNADESESMKLQYWNPLDDGVLSVAVNDRETVSASYNFIKAAIMQFMFSYPAMDKQIFYCCNKLSGDMDVFLRNMENGTDGLGEEIFYRQTRYITSFSANEYINFLRNEIGDRLEKLYNSGSGNVYDYNAKNPKDARKPIFVILDGYPENYERCENLEYLFEDGEKAGVFCLVVSHTFADNRNGFGRDVTEPESFANLRCVLSKDSISVNGEKYEPVKINDAKRRALIHSLRDAKNNAKKSFVSYAEIGFGEYAPPKTDGLISIPVGTAGKDVYSIKLSSSGNENCPIGYFVLGDSKTGKSSILDAMIINGSMAYSPDDLIFYLLDFKDGMLGESYLGANAIPHVRVIAQKNKEEDAAIILESLEKEKENRNAIFKKKKEETGVPIPDIAAYNKRSEKHMPNIIVIIDECQALFESQKLIALCSDLIRKGRSTGIFFVLATQIFDISMKKPVSQLWGRVCFATNESNASNIFENGAYAKRVTTDLSEKGTAFISDDKGNHCELFKSAWHNQEINGLNRKIREKWSDYENKLVIAGQTSIVYIDAECEQKRENVLCSSDELRIPYGVNFFDQSAERFDLCNSEGSLEDESVSTKDNRTVLVLGESDDVSTSILTSVTVGALRSGAKLNMIDASKDSELSGFFGSHPSVKVKTPDEYLELLREAMGEYEYRSTHIKEEHKPYFLILHGIHRIQQFLNNTVSDGAGAEAASSAERADGAPNGFVNLRALRRATATVGDGKKIGGKIYGKDDFFKLLSNLTNAPGMYIVITGTKTVANDSSMRKAWKDNVDYMLLQSDIDDKIASNLIDDFRNNMMSDMKKSMVFVSAEHEKLFKARPYIYDFNKPEVKKIIKGALEQ